MTPYEEKLLRDRIVAQTSQLRAPVTLGSRVNAQLQQPIPPGMMNQSAGRPVAPAGSAALKAEMMRSQERGATGRALATADMPQGRTVNGLYLAPGWGELIGAGAQKLAGAHLVGKSRKEAKDLEKKATGLEQATAEYEAELADFENEQSQRQALAKIDYQIDANLESAKVLEDHKGALQREERGDQPFEGTSEFAQAGNAMWPKARAAGWTMEQFREDYVNSRNRETFVTVGDQQHKIPAYEYTDYSQAPPTAGGTATPTPAATDDAAQDTVQKPDTEREMTATYTVAQMRDASKAATGFVPRLFESYAEYTGPLKGFLQSDNYKTYKNNAAQWTQSKVFLQSGATAREDEIERDFETYFAQPGDSPDIVKEKAQMREASMDNAEKAYLASARATAGGNATPTPPGADLPPVWEMSPQEVLDEIKERKKRLGL